MNVRALPTWRNPVGEGANRTLGPGVDKLSFLIGVDESGMRDFMVSAGEKKRQATVLPGWFAPHKTQGNRFHLKRLLSTTLYLNRIEFLARAMKR